MRNVLRLALTWILVMSSVWSLAVTTRTSDEDLRNLWQQGDLPKMERLAIAGDVRAQHWMGLMLHNRGRYDEAIQWYTRAYDGGDGFAASQIAFFYEQGIGRPRDTRTALAWHLKGAELGHASSQIRYATALREGTVLARNDAEAFSWFTKAAEQPIDAGQLGYAYLPVAEMLAQGVGTPKNLVRAYAFAKAAEFTVDDSDVTSQRRADELQEDIAAQLTFREQNSAEQMFASMRPDVAQRIIGRRVVKGAVVLFIGGGALLLWIVIRLARRGRSV